LFQAVEAGVKETANATLVQQWGKKWLKRGIFAVYRLVRISKYEVNKMKNVKRGRQYRTFTLLNQIRMKRISALRYYR
jgi:hypothetical protein